jgi:electron transport complex protein RnfB
VAVQFPLVERIDALLPQTQCGKCGFVACRPYAEAIASGKADINQCPPGGQSTILALAELLDRDPRPLNLEHGIEKPAEVAVIDEQSCIGCTLCIRACPVDAILGAARHMHTVIEAECTGCELCVAPCPVDCITMIPAPQSHQREIQEQRRQKADQARTRYQSRLERLARERQEETARAGEKKRALKTPITRPNEDPRKAVIAAALARVRARKGWPGTN